MADTYSNHLSIGAGFMYERGMDMTVSYEHETKYHNSWEYFANGYLKWDDCASCGHICPETFWNNYRTWMLGVAYKPCLNQGRNNIGNLRIGFSAGSDLSSLVYAVNIGYQHTYTLKKGWNIYWQVKTDILPEGRDLFRTGFVIGVSIPTN